jgi:undecaprenyl-diphosphatase
MDSGGKSPGDRRESDRGPLTGAPRDALYSILRFIARHIRGFWGAIVAFLSVGLLIAVAAAVLFGLLAGIVQGGWTQSVDEAVLQWLAALRSPTLDSIMYDITTLGDGIVLIMIVLIASVFLWLTKHHWSVYILMVGMVGGKILNTVLKAAFDRTRPSVVEWFYEVTSPSFPSGHAMGAFITYGTVAYLVGRLSPTPLLRNVTWLIAALTISAIGVSRMYLGVHYPSDVIAGFMAGLAWLAFVAASVSALRFFAPRRPETAVEERDLDAAERQAAAGQESHPA